MSRAMRILKNVSEAISPQRGILQFAFLHPHKQSVLVLVGQIAKAGAEGAARLFIERFQSAPPRLPLARRPRAPVAVLFISMQFIVDQRGHWDRWP